MTAQRRYELTDSEWERLKKYFPEREAGDLGRPRNDDRQMLNGVLISNRSPRESSAAFGEEIIQKAVETALPEVRDRLAHPEYYRNHGRCLMEGRYLRCKRVDEE